MGKVLSSCNTFEENKKTEAQKIIDEVILQAQTINNPDYLAKAYTLKGDILREIGVGQVVDYRFDALDNYLKALEIRLKEEDYMELARCNYKITNFFNRVGIIEQGKEYLDSTKTAFSRASDPDSTLFLNYTVIELLLLEGTKIGNPEYYQEIEDWIDKAEKKGFDRFRSEIFGLYRSSLIRSGNFAKLHAFYINKFPKDFALLKSSESELYYRVMAYWNESQKQIDSADYYWQIAVDKSAMNNKSDSNYRVINSLMRYSEFLHRTEQDSKAVGHLEIAWAYADSLDEDYFRLHLSKLFLNVYKRLGDFKKALKWQEVYADLNNKTIRSQRTDGFRMTEIVYKSKLVQERLQAENEQKTRESFAYKIGLFLFLLISVFAFYQTTIIRKEKKRSDDLLLNILPKETAEELKQKGTTTARRYNNVTILFADVVSFSRVAETLKPQELVAVIDEYFRAFDDLMEIYGLEKIKTIGDAYVAVGGLPAGNTATAKNVVQAAMAMLRVVNEINEKKENISLQMRFGINTGDVVAGVVGNKKFQFDIWGDAVNVAARMEQAGWPNRINISKSTYEQVKEDFTCTFRGKIEAKNKGALEMYFVEINEKHENMPV